MRYGDVEAYEVFPGLFIGPAPKTGAAVATAGFDVLLLCAAEYQPDGDKFPGVWVEHCPMVDDPITGITDADIRRAAAASRLVENALLHRRTVLVTCKAGIDRSALVAGLAIFRLTAWSGKRILAEMRRARPVALTLNPSMRRLIETL